MKFSGLLPLTRADPGFSKGGGAAGSGAPNIFLANIRDFLKNLAHKGVGVDPHLN